MKLCFGRVLSRVTYGLSTEVQFLMKLFQHRERASKNSRSVSKFIFLAEFAHK